MPTDHESALNHKYRLNGEPLVNVTAVSSLLDDGKSSAFAGAAVKLTKEGKDYRQTWKESRERGTRVHGHCEAFLRGEPIDCLPSDMGFVDGVADFISDHDPYIVDLERVVLSRSGYGGRFDMILDLDGIVSLLDLKTGRPYAVEHTLQLSAYRYADGIAEYHTDGSFAGLRTMPEIERAGCLYVTEDGGYQIVWYPADMYAYGVFLSLLDAHKWARSEDVKAAIKEARA